MIYYMIRKKDDPTLFVKGTPFYHSYHTNGRVFSKLGHLRSFLSLAMNNEYRKHEIAEWEIVELEMVVKEVKPVHEVIKAEKIIKLLKI